MATLIDAIPLLNTLRDAVFLSASVSEIEDLTPRMRRVRLQGPRLQGLKWTPGQHVRLQVAGLLESVLRLHAHDALRTYSIYDADPDIGALDIVMLDHAGDPKVITPARHRRLRPPSGIPSTSPGRRATLIIEHDAPYHLFAGEETASVAFAAMLRSLPSTVEVHGVIEGATDADHLPLTRPLTHVERGDASAANSVVLAEALRALPLPDHPGVAYLAGEARTIQSLRKTLVTERGWDRRNIRTKPFWTPGRSGMEQPARPQPPPSARDRACRPAASRGVRAQAGWRLSASRPARARQSAPGQHVAVGRFHGSSLGQIRMVRQ